MFGGVPVGLGAGCSAPHLLPGDASPGFVLEVLLEIGHGGLAGYGWGIVGEEFLELVFEALNFAGELLWCHKLFLLRKNKKRPLKQRAFVYINILKIHILRIIQIFFS